MATDLNCHEVGHAASACSKKLAAVKSDGDGEQDRSIAQVKKEVVYAEKLRKHLQWSRDNEGSVRLVDDAGEAISNVFGALVADPPAPEDMVD